MASVARVLCRASLLALAVCAVTADASGTSPRKRVPDRSARTAHLLADAAHLIAQDGWTSLTLYRVADGAVVHRFPAPAHVGRFALSLDESRLLVGCRDGTLVLWRIDTGERVWQVPPGASGLRSVGDVSFAGNGGRLIACDGGDRAAALDTRTGGTVGEITAPSGQGGIVSVALNPDGTRGFVIVKGWGLGRFDLAAGHATDASLAAYGSVRYSADGAHVAFPTQSWGMDPQLAVASAGDGSTKRALGRFADIGRVRPLSDGSFLVTARVGRGDDDSAACAGTQVWPDGRVREAWRLTPGPRPNGRALLPLEFVSPQRVNDRTDFLPEPMTGVTTDWQFVTAVTDLRTGVVVRTIDNSAGRSAEPDASGTAEPNGVWWVPAAGAAAAVIVVLAGGLVWRPYRRRGRGR